MNIFEHIVNELNNVFTRWTEGKAWYIGRDMNNSEVAFFGGTGTSTGVKEKYTDSPDASVSDPLMKSPTERLRASFWDGTEVKFFSFKSEVEAISATEGKVTLSLGVFPNEVPFVVVRCVNGEIIWDKPQIAT